MSGRGESSRRAIGRGIHQVFPTMTDGELQAYLLDLMERRVGLWEHYSQLTGQLARLRQSLRQWRRDASNPLDALRRRRVATAVRRSWRLRRRWPKRAPEPLPGARSSSSRRPPSRGLRRSSASTRPVTNVATSYRVRIARTGSGCALSNCGGTRGSQKPQPTYASRATPRLPNTTRR